jgi:tetratricopeptide (TPR) repeat protein
MEHASILCVDAMATNDDKEAYDKCIMAKDAYLALYPCAKVCSDLGAIFKRLGNLEYVAEEHEEAMKYYQQSAEYYERSELIREADRICLFRQ